MHETCVATFVCRDGSVFTRQIDYVAARSVIFPVLSADGFVCRTCEGSGEGQCAQCDENHCRNCGGSGTTGYGEVVFSRTSDTVFEETAAPEYADGSGSFVFRGPDYYE